MIERMAPQPVFRFAPSPNGFLHLGHALSALVNRRMADAAGGRLLLRIEDIDPVRCRPEYETALRADLEWLGIRFDGPPLRQSERIGAHRAALAGLQARGLLYPCFCSRGAIARAVAERPGWPRDPDGAPLYPGTCRGLSPEEREARIARGDPFVLRLDMAAAVREIGTETAWTEIDRDLHAAARQACDPLAWGDVVLGRKETPTSYHLAVVLDDAAEGVTHVVRGADLRASTCVHVVLQALFGLPQPLYHHHGLVLGEDGRKLSKSTGSTALSALRKAGWTPAHVTRHLTGLGLL